MSVKNRYNDLAKDLPNLTSSSGSSFAFHQNMRNTMLQGIAETLLREGYSYQEVLSVVPDLDIRLPTAKGQGLTFENQFNYVGNYDSNPVSLEIRQQLFSSPVSPINLLGINNWQGLLFLGLGSYLIGKERFK